MIAVTFTALALIAIVAWLLVVNRRYEDGLIGRVALAGMALAATGFMSKIVFSCYQPTGLEEALIWSTAAFMARHYYRFLRYTRTGEHAWHSDHPMMSRGEGA